METGNVVADKSYAFSVRIVKMCRSLSKRHTTDYVLIRQVLKSGTAIGALVSEAKFAQSKADFINKNNIALKEANETKYWLNLFHDTGILSEKEYTSICPDCVELVKILVSIINSLKTNSKEVVFD